MRESFEVFQTPYYLPTVEGTLQAVCPGDSVFVEVIPDDDENFVSYEWVPNWNNGGGEVWKTSAQAHGSLLASTKSSWRMKVAVRGAERFC